MRSTVAPRRSKRAKGWRVEPRSNALFLSVAAQFNGEIAGEVMNWMTQFRNISGMNDAGYMEFTAKRLSDSEYGPLMQELVKQADIGIESLERQDIAREKILEMIPMGSPKRLSEFNILAMGMPKPFELKTFRKRFDADDKPAGLVEFDLKDDESAGTQKFVAISGRFLHTLQQGSILFVDELEARLHPLLTKSLVGLFNAAANRKNAQLIYATHEDGLLDSAHIRRDQVWFVEKDKFGASQLFSLAEYKVRKEAKFGKEYLLGLFGGVPRLRDFERTLTHAK